MRGMTAAWRPAPYPLPMSAPKPPASSGLRLAGEIVADPEGLGRAGDVFEHDLAQELTDPDFAARFALELERARREGHPSASLAAE